MQGVDGGDDSENNHDGRQTKRNGAKRAVPMDTLRRDEGDLNYEKKHPQGEDCSVDVEDRTWKRGTHDPRLEIGWSEPDVDADAEQGGHAGVKDSFRCSVDAAMGMSARRGRREHGIGCHSSLHLNGDLRGSQRIPGMRGRYHAAAQLQSDCC